MRPSTPERRAREVAVRLEAAVPGGEPPGDDDLVCPSDGLLGMDVLQRWTLVSTRLQAFARCDP